jgi:PhnB protein
MDATCAPGESSPRGRKTIMANVKPIPEGHHTITPSLAVKGGRKAIEFYTTALGATVRGDVMADPKGNVMHAELMIGNSLIFVGDEFPEMGVRSPQTLGGSPVTFNVYTEDCDATFHRAVAAGATAVMPPADMFWGDRYARFSDPFGHQWGVATHKEDLTAEEITRRAREAMQPK